jgi:hypothetical protein
VNAQSATLCITPPAGEQLALTQRLSRLLLALAQFFRSGQILSEVWTLYNTATAVVADLSMRAKEASDQPHATLSNSESDVDTRSERRMSGCQGLRGFKFALTLTLLINRVLGTHFPRSKSLADFRHQFANEALPTNAEQLMPKGAGFMGTFLDHIWATEDQTTEAPGAWDSLGAETANRRSITFSKKLESTLESLL